MPNSRTLGRKLTNGALVILSLLVSVLAAELLLNAFLPYGGIQVSRVGNKIVDRRDPSRALLDLLSQGVEAYPALYPALLIGDAAGDAGRLTPLGGIARTTTTFCNELEKFIIYQSDRFGFYNDDALWDKPPHALLVGDSFSHSACVPAEATIGANLTRLGLPTVSIGMNGSGPLLELASLIEYGSLLKPPVVLWQYSELNDLHDIAREVRWPALARYYLDKSFQQNLVARQNEIDALLKAKVHAMPEYQRIEKAAKTAGFVHTITRFRNTRGLINKSLARLAGRDFRDTLAQPQAAVLPSELQGDQLETLSVILRRAKEMITSWGGKMYFVYLPQWERFNAPQRASQYHNEVARIVESAGIPFIDLSTDLERYGNPSQFYAYPDRGGHFTEEGYRVVSQHIFDSLRR